MSKFAKIEIDLKFALKDKRNVLLSGLHGCGKTETIKALFNEKYGAGNWKYYSTPTMDIFVDLIGCPKVVNDNDGNGDYLKLIKPKEWTNDSIRALFLDEIPRAQEKVKNTLMELLLFKSINGQHYPNLEVIWAAENPVDAGYSGEELDEAIKDRFPIQIDFPYEINFEYFEKKFGSQIATAANDWWSVLDKEKKRLVSPRRLECAIEIIQAGGDVNNVLPSQVHPGKLLKEIQSGSTLDQLKKILKKKNNKVLLEKFFAEENNYFSTKDYIIQHNNKLLEYINEERLAEVISNNETVRNYILDNLKNCEKYVSVINEIVTANSNEELVNEIKKNINYYHIIIEKEANNPELQALEDQLKTLIKSDSSTVFNKDPNIDTEAKYADLDKLDYDKIYKFVESNDTKFAGSEFADEIIYLIKKKYGTKYPKADDLMTTIREYGC